MSDSSRKRKKYGENRGGNRQPRRGGPGVLLTCETGRESKCRREGLDILLHYYYKKNSQSEANQNKNEDLESKATKSITTEAKSLSLDEEIAMLNSGATTNQVLSLQGNDGVAAGDKQKRNNKKASPFALYDTSCRGTMFYMCTLSNCSLMGENTADVPKDGGGNKREPHNEGPAETELTKKPRTEKEAVSTSEVKDTDDTEKPVESPGDEGAWDPLTTVATVIQDLEKAGDGAPSSRFVTRMIPIQVTCFASVDEIRATAKVLLERKLWNRSPEDPTQTDTYAVVVKRRNCSNVTREQVINTIVELMTKSDCNRIWKVDLKHPQFTVHVEICTTLCGMSVIPNCQSFRNFNLVQIRESLLLPTTENN